MRWTTIGFNNQEAAAPNHKTTQTKHIYHIITHSIVNYKSSKKWIMQPQSRSPEPMPLHYCQAESTSLWCWVWGRNCEFLLLLVLQLEVSRTEQCPQLLASHPCCFCATMVWIGTVTNCFARPLLVVSNPREAVLHSPSLRWTHHHHHLLCAFTHTHKLLMTMEWNTIMKIMWKVTTKRTGSTSFKKIHTHTLTLTHTNTHGHTQTHTDTHRHTQTHTQTHPQLPHTQLQQNFGQSLLTIF